MIPAHLSPVTFWRMFLHSGIGFFFYIILLSILVLMGPQEELLLGNLFDGVPIVFVSLSDYDRFNLLLNGFYLTESITNASSRLCCFNPCMLLVSFSFFFVEDVGLLFDCYGLF